MKNYEAFLTIREKILVDELRIPQLEGELVHRRSRQPQLEEEAHRAWALEEPDAGKLKAAAEENEKAIVRLDEEVKKLKKRVETLKKESIPAQEAAIRDLQVYYRKAAEPLVVEYAKRLRAAAETEAELARLNDEATEKGYQVAGHPRIIMPPMLRLL